MRKTLVIFLLSLFIVFTTKELIFATNGDNLIGLSPASRAMGGIGVGMPVGPTDSIFRNPAWMSYYKDFNLSFGGIIFMPNVKGRSKTFIDPDGSNSLPPMLFDSQKHTSDAKVFVVPEVGITHQINEKLNFGIGAFGVSGMGVDYRDKTINEMPALADMHTNFQFMRFIPALAYKINENLSISGAIHIAYGSLDMGAKMCGDITGDGIPDATSCWNAGGGQSQAYGIGFQLGIAYNQNDFLFLGLTYQSPVKMTYDNVFDSDDDGDFEGLKLTQPQEISFGIGIKPKNNFKIGADVRWINWSDAEGYDDFEWKDQWVLGIGAEYKPMQNLALRAGYNYGRSPIRGGAKTINNINNIPDFKSQYSDFNIAWFNLIGFPAITEHHLTFGFGYQFTPKFGVEVSYVYAFEKKVKARDNMNMGMEVEGSNEQNSISIGLTWKF